MGKGDGPVGCCAEAQVIVAAIDTAARSIDLKVIPLIGFPEARRAET
jgi:hypothetical protein